MGRLWDKLGEIDDRSNVYRAGNAERKIRWPMLLVAVLVYAPLGAFLVVLFTGVLDDVVGEDVANGIAFGGALLFVVAYVIWRRRRNRRLTGSPTTWPTAEHSKAAD